VEEILARVRAGTLSVRRAAQLLRLDAVQRLGTQLKLDLHRAERTGIPEVILAEGKEPADVREAARAFLRSEGRAIVSRVPEGFRLGRFPGATVEVHREARTIVLRRRGQSPRRTGGRIAILTAGASDRRVAAEAEVVAHELGAHVRTERDVGIASLKRLLDALERIEPWEPHAWIVLAGREGALASVVAGLVDGPVIGVPVSTGYGHRGKGEAALSAMLQSCAPLVVVNIDAGFVAGAVAAQVANRVAHVEGRSRRRVSVRRGKESR
jgi:pyridinium-3,5-biscarboxylic acid mononucleotide synthase